MLDLSSSKFPFPLLSERDMDLLVIEEIMSSKPFRDWLVTKLYNNTRQLREFIGVFRCFELAPLGSVDILMLFKDVSGRKCAILVENKIDQPKQNLQAQRYFEFGEAGIQQGGWDEYLTCLFSPQAYFSTLEPSEYFSSYLSYEELCVWFQNAVMNHSITPDRAGYKIRFVQQAIAQETTQRMAPVPTAQPVMNSPAPVAPNVQQMQMPLPSFTTDAPVLSEPVLEEPAPAVKTKTSMSDFRVFPGGVFNLPKGYIEAEDSVVGKFWNDCFTIATQKYPHLNWQQPTGSAKEAGWAEMNPSAFPKEVKIIHKMPQGYMDLTFAMATVQMIQAPYQRFMDSDMSIKESGKAAVIRITIPPMNPDDGIDSQRELLMFALQKAEKLYQLYKHVIQIS